METHGTEMSQAKKKNKSMGDEDFCLITRLYWAVSVKAVPAQRRLQSIKLPLRACQSDNSWKKLTFQIHQPTLLLFPPENKWLDSYSLGSFALSCSLQTTAGVILHF